MIANCRPMLLIDREMYLSEPRVGSSLSVTDFLTARRSKVEEEKGVDNQIEIELEILRARRRRSVHLFDPLEHFTYSLVSAAALAALLLGGAALLDYSRHEGTGHSGLAIPSALRSNAQNYADQFQQGNTRPE